MGSIIDQWANVFRVRQRLVCATCGELIAESAECDPITEQKLNPSLEAMRDGMTAHRAATGHSDYRYEDVQRLFVS